MKLFKLLFSLLFLLALSINYSAAAGDTNVCPGQPATLTWSKTNVTSCSPSATNFSCNFVPSNTDGTQSQPVSLGSGSCSVTLSCTGSGGSASDSATLNVVNGPQCCNQYSQVGLTVWNGSACVAPAAGAPTLNVSISPSTVTVGSTYTSNWSSTNATGVTAVCTGSLPGTYPSPVNGSASDIALAANIGFTNCAWTATGPGGSITVNTPLTIVAATVNCPTGYTGTPPNCVYTPTSCPTGYTGTPPNCIPPAACTNGAANPPVCNYFPQCANGATNYPGCSIFPACQNGATNAPACTIGVKQPIGDIYEFPSDTAAPSRPCIIEVATGNNPRCNAFLGWTTKYLTSAPTAVTYPSSIGTVTFSTSPSSGGTYASLQGISPVTFYLYHNAVLLDQVTVTPTCAIGSDWNGSKCVAGTCANGATNYPTCNIFPPCANGLNSTYQPLCACSAVQEQLPGSDRCTFKINTSPVKISAFLIQPTQIACPGGNDEATLKFILNNTPGKTCRISAKEVSANPVLSDKTEQMTTLNSSTQLKSNKYRSSNSSLSGYTKTFEQLIEDRNTNTGASGGDIIMKAPKFTSGKRLFNYSTRFTMECGSLAEPIATRYVKTNASYSSKSVDMLSVCTGQD